MTDTVLDCGHTPTPTTGIGTGYATDRNGKTLCYECAAAAQRADMEREGKISLYLITKENGDNEITDWSGYLRFKAGPVSKGRHNIARVRYDVWFTARGRTWHGVQYGDDTQIVHCRRLKAA